ncbi:MAG: dehydratase [Alphaproteobacteria bacterium]|nr:MAG: dehydratase [Alphaproteobacteria bacterium]
MKAFEDFIVGAKKNFGDYLVTEAEIIEFARKYDPQPIHTDPEFAKKSFHGQLIASGWLTCSIMMRMLCDDFLTDSSSIGSPGVEKLRWIRPVFVGDRLKASATILTARLSKSKPGVGIMNYKVDVLNQKDEMVMTLTSTGMFLTRAAAKDAQL